MKAAVPAHSMSRNHPRGQSVPEPIYGRRVSVLEGHAIWAASYDYLPNPLLAVEERRLEPLLPGLHDKFVLDVGCGTGRWLRKLLRRGAGNGAGVDLSPEMLGRASTKLVLRGRLVCGDGLSLPIREGVADLVMCSFVVGYLTDLRAFAGEIARVTRPQGQVFVSDFHPSGYGRGWRRAFRSGDKVIEIASLARPIVEICGEFEAKGFELKVRLEPCFGEPERAFFDRCGRNRLFDAAREGPAIFICQFQRTSQWPY